MTHYYWLIKKTPTTANWPYKYMAIDCNHRLEAFRSIREKTVLCLVFPKNIPEEEVEFIAGKYFYNIQRTFK